MDAQTLLNDLRRNGLKVFAEGNNIAVTPGGRLTESQRALIKTLKPDILNALSRTALPMPPLGDWAPFKRFGALLGDQVLIEGSEFQLWGVTPRGAICWDGSSLRTFDISDVAPPSDAAGRS